MRRTPEELDELVMAVLAKESRPVTAYELVSLLSDECRSVAPQQAYRVLDRLVGRGDVVRLETLNAYCASRHEGGVPIPIVFCRKCRASFYAPCPGLREALAGCAARAGFQALRFIAEVSGLCPACCEAAARKEEASPHVG